VIKEGMSADEKKMWERRYELPKNPRILIHPNSEAKGGAFDCITMTLSVLRDYRVVDKKEESFEVSLFSELFWEMLQRDFGFRIYREMLWQSKNSPPASVDAKKDAKEVEATDSSNSASTKVSILVS